MARAGIEVVMAPQRAGFPEPPVRSATPAAATAWSGEPEEIFACDVCGTLSRTRSRACPACGAGHG